MKKLLICALILIFGFVGLTAQEKKEQKKTDFLFSLGGGTVNNEFTLTGDMAYATKLNSILLQSSAFVDRNSFIQDYGISAGFGLEPENVGLYLFFDGMSRGVKGYKSVFHYQVRPAGRYQGGKFALSLFYAFPLSHRILLEEQISDPVFWQNSSGYYYSLETRRLWSVALKYAGGELEVVPFRFLKLSAQGLMADSKTYQVTLGSELKLFNWMSLNAEYTKFRLGDHFSVAWQNYDAFRFGGVLRFGGGRDVFRDLTQRRIVTPQYPFIVNEVEKEKKDIKISALLKAGATGTPEKGCAPLTVYFRSLVSGGVLPYRYFWDFKDGFTSADANPTHVFTKPGTYCVEFNVFDSAGHMDAVCICIIVENCPGKTTDLCEGTAINSFVSDRTVIKRTETVKLNWSVAGATGLKLNGGWVDFVGNKMVTLDKTGTFSYTLDAYKDGSICKSQTINITVVECDPPIITRFDSNLYSVISGGKVMIGWQTSNADSVTLDGSPVSNWGGQEFIITATRIFTLVAKNKCAEETKTITVTLCNAPTVVSLTASPTGVLVGQKSTISWETTGATSVTLEGEAVSVTGSKEFTITAARTFTLVAKNDCSQTTKTVSVSICNAPEITSLVATPSSVVSGGKTTVSWATTGATAVTLDGIAVALSGSKEFTVTANKTFTLVAKNSCSEVTKTVSVTVYSCTLCDSIFFHADGSQTKIWNTLPCSGDLSLPFTIFNKSTTCPFPVQLYWEVLYNTGTPYTGTIDLGVIPAGANPANFTFTFDESLHKGGVTINSCYKKVTLKVIGCTGGY